jgi:hypothetical protein
LREGRGGGWLQRGNGRRQAASWAERSCVAELGREEQRAAAVEKDSGRSENREEINNYMGSTHVKPYGPKPSSTIDVSLTST